MKRVMEHQSGLRVNVKDGFSWTILFFGIFVPLFRGDFKWFFIMLFAGIFTCGLSNLVFMFIYNKKYINGLLEKGYVFVN